MNRAGLHTWGNLTEDGSVRWLPYSFGPGRANTLAVRVDDGSWLVVSPAAGAPASALDELAADGEVRALVTPNAYHHLGQEPWRRRFPEATSYAPEGALARLSKKSASVPYRPIEELRERVGARVHPIVPGGQKAPDLLLRVSAGTSTIWWLGDLFSNAAAGDQAWFLRLIGSLAGSGLGYRRNTKPGLVYVSDEAAWLRSVRSALESHPPSVVVPAHGAPVVEDTARRTRQLLDNSGRP